MLLNGTVPPASGDGVDGDFWIDTATWHIYGPKDSGAWPSGVNMIGHTATNAELDALIIPRVTAATAGLQAQIDALAARPIITSTGPLVGDTVTVSWPGHVLTVVQWTRNGVDIAGATSAAYTRTTADLAALLAPRVQAEKLATADPVVTVAPPLAAGGWALGSTRLALAGSSSTATATALYARSQVAVGLPVWTGKIRVLLAALHATNGALVSLPNDLKINWMTFFRGSTPLPIKVGGVINPTLPGGSLIWSDPVEDMSGVPVDSLSLETLHFRSELNTPAGTRFPVTYYPVLGGQDLGEGRAAGTVTTPDPSLRTGGTIPATTASNALVWGPVAVAVSGWDGTTRVMLLLGDSRDVGVNDFVVRAATRGTMGGPARGLDDPASGRIAFANFSIRGARAATFANNWGQIWSALQTLPNLPFHDVMTSINGNDINGSSPLTTLDQMKAADLAHWAAIRQQAPSAKIYHCFGQPWTSDTSGGLFTTVAGQTPAPASTAPSGLLQQTNDWLASGVGLPPYVKPIDLGAAVQAPGAPDRWSVSGITGTLVSAASRTVVANLSAPPPLGDPVVISIGGSVLNLTVTNFTGTGPYTMTTAEGVTGTHTAGDIVGVAAIRDGIHESQSSAKAEADIIKACKLDGTIPPLV